MSMTRWRKSIVPWPLPRISAFPTLENLDNQRAFGQCLHTRTAATWGLVPAMSTKPYPDAAADAKFGSATPAALMTRSTSDNGE